MQRVIFNQKGGVGKSTITCNLAAINAAKGRRTLVIDLDAQGNSTQYLLGENIQHVERTLVDFFQAMLNFSIFRDDGLSVCIHPTPFENLAIAPSHPELNELQDKLESRYKMYKLRDALDGLTEYDDVFIDTPPALNFFTRSALIAAECCLIPFDCDQFARTALYTLMNNIREIQQDHNADLYVEGIVVNQFLARANLPRQIVDELKQEGLPVLNTHISTSIKIRESHQNCSPMIHFAPGHKVTQEFEALYQELGK